MSQIASSVNFSREDRVLRKIPIGAIMTLAMLGVFERGPIGNDEGAGELVFDFTDFQRVYGGYTTDGNAPLVARAYFNNGGTRMRPVRIVHFSDATDASSRTSTKAARTLQTEALAASQGAVVASIAEPYVLANGDTLSFSVDGGGSDVATFNAAAATRTAGTTGTYNLASGGETLTVAIDGGSVQTVTFQTSMFATPAAATATEVAAAMNGQLTGCSVDVDSNAPRITSDTLGTGSGVNVSGGTANAILGFTTGNVAGTGDAVNAAAVTIAELKTLIEGDVTGVTVSSSGGYLQVVTDTSGAAGSIQVEAVSTADDEIGLDNASHAGTDSGAVNTLTITAKTDGDWANSMIPVVSPSSTAQTGYFKLEMKIGGVAVDVWDDVTMDDTSDRYIETVVNNSVTGSDYITVVDLDAVATAANQAPAIGTHSALSGGDDGLTSLGDADFNGGTGANGDVGLRVLDRFTDIDVLISPDRATSSHHNALITYADVTREGDVFVILDPPATNTASAMATYVRTTAALFQLTENAAMYWPRVKVLNPNTAVLGNTRLVTIPPSGHVAGVYARTDQSKPGGMFEQPAGLDSKFLPRGIEELETTEVTDIKKRELLVQLNVNFISQEDGTSFFIDGARPLDISGSFNTIGISRGALFIGKRLKPALGFLRHRNLKPRVYNEGKMTIEAFMDSLQAEGAFESYQADLSSALNTASVKAQRRIKARIGVAFWGIGEIVDVFIGPDSDSLQSQLAA